MGIRVNPVVVNSDAFCIIKSTFMMIKIGNLRLLFNKARFGVLKSFSWSFNLKLIDTMC